MCLSTSSDCIAEPHLEIVSFKPNLKIDTFDVAENSAHKQKETVHYKINIACWRVISDQLRDHCCLVGSLDFQYLDADFSASETCIAGDKFKWHCTKSLLFRSQLNGEKVKCEWLCYLPSSKKLYRFMCKLFAFDLDENMLALVGYGDLKYAPRDLARH